MHFCLLALSGTCTGPKGFSRNSLSYPELAELSHPQRKRCLLSPLCQPHSFAVLSKPWTSPAVLESSWTCRLFLSQELQEEKLGQPPHSARGPCSTRLVVGTNIYGVLPDGQGALTLLQGRDREAKCQGAKQPGGLPGVSPKAKAETKLHSKVKEHFTALSLLCCKVCLKHWLFEEAGM